MVRCGSKNGNVFKEQYVYKGHWTTCSKFVIHARLNSQHNWGYDQSMRKNIYTLIMNKIFI